jgi:agmatinase
MDETVMDQYPRGANGRGPIDASVVPRFAGLATFARLPQAGSAHADVGIQGVPFDAGVSYRPGARFGPAHVRESSRLLRPLNPAQDVEPFTDQEVVDLGDIPANPFSIDEAIRQIEHGTRQNLERADRLLTIGGDHTIALPILRALHAVHGPIAVVHFDAHLDTWDTYFGQPYTHGTPFLRASEEGLLAQGHCQHVGIRGPLYSREDLPRDGRAGFDVITSDDVELEGTQGVIDRIVDRTAGAPIYLSVDIDVLDPAFAPGTGTPEAGGITSRELLRMIRGFRGLNLVGVDVVEVAPAYDHAQITGIAAAHVLYEALSTWVPNHHVD